MQEEYLFADDDADEGVTMAESGGDTPPWQVLVVDDEPEVYTLTKLNLQGIEFRGANIQPIPSYSADEALMKLKAANDIAVILLDVVMESDTAGLDLVDTIRNELKNQRVRIILRTGQPGHAPELEVVQRYDINDYRAKTDLTRERLVTTVIGALRNYADMQDIERIERERKLIEERAAARALFLASVSHEVRTPMHGILGTLELLANTKPTDDQQALMKICHDSASYLLSIIDDILDFSKIDAGKLDINPEVLNPSEMVYNALDQLASRAWMKDVELIVAVEPDVPVEVVADPVRLQQVLINLVGNAIKFTDNGHVAVRLAYREKEDGAGQLSFEVEDTGVGISKEEADRLFTPFEQASENTTRKYGGTGLGLAISRQLVDLMKGDISLSSEPGRGSTFRFSVEVSEARRDEKVGGQLSGQRILLLGDNGIETSVIIDLLEDAGAEVDVPPRASQAADILLDAYNANRRYSAVLIDENVQDHHCIHWLRAIRNEAVLKAVPIAVMVRRSSGSLISRLRDYGIEQILMKLVRPEALIDAVQTLVGVPHEALPEASAQGSKVSSLEASVATKIRFPDARVLVADDSLTNQIVIRRMLEHLGVTVRTVENGRDALEALALGAGNYHLVFMDCFMPDMEGYEVVRRLREFENGSADRLAVVALSASYLPEDIEASKEAGMDDYVCKPTDIAKLASVLDKWLPDTCMRAEAEEALVSEDGLAPQTRTGKVSVYEQGEKAGIDLSTVMEVYGSLNGKVRVLVDIFMRDVPKFLTRLETAANAEDSEEARRAAHNISGSCGVIGGITLGRAAQKVEEMAREEQWDNVRAELNGLNRSYERMCRFFEAIDWHK